MTAPWSAGRPALGTWVKIPAPEVVELLAAAGLDFLVIDTEHALIGPQTVSTMIMVARGCGIEPFVRVAGHTARDVVSVLDAGVAGVFLPHIDDGDQARSAVRSCRFPPHGTRGASPSGRAGGWGSAGLERYLARGNTEVRVVAQLESVTALANAAEIAAVDGVDAVFVGPVDLSVSAGVVPHDDRLRHMVGSAVAACSTAGVAMGTVAATADEAVARIVQGHRFVMIGNDAAFLTGAAAAAVLATHSRSAGALRVAGSSRADEPTQGRPA